MCGGGTLSSTLIRALSSLSTRSLSFIRSRRGVSSCGRLADR